MHDVHVMKWLISLVKEPQEFWFTQVFAGNEVADESDVTEPQAFWLIMHI